MVSSIIIYRSFSKYFNLNKTLLKNKIINIFLLTIVFSCSGIFLYLNLSNFWIGNSLLDKITIKTNIKNEEANKVAIIEKAIEALIGKIEKDPENLELILQLAEARFILGNFAEAKYLYQKAGVISPGDIEITKAEAKTRLLLEDDEL